MLPVNPFSNLLEEEHPIGTEIEVTLIDEKGDCRHNCINFIGKGKLHGRFVLVPKSNFGLKDHPLSRTVHFEPFGPFT